MSKLTKLLNENKKVDSPLVKSISELLITAQKTKAVDNKIEEHLCDILKKSLGDEESLSQMEKTALKLHPVDFIVTISSVKHTCRGSSYNARAIRIIENLIEFFERPVEEHEEWMSFYKSINE